jgi:hypothetical protein
VYPAQQTILDNTISFRSHSHSRVSGVVGNRDHTTIKNNVPNPRLANKTIQRAQGGVEALRRQIQRAADRAALEIYAAEVNEEEV